MQIKVYSTPNCPYCVMAKDFFKAQGLEYQDVNVAEDQNAFQEMIQKSGQMGVPVIDIDGNIVMGFNRPEIEKLIK
ncbi:MAG TPA: glutaredoxin family protein [Candidatus Paceibacterota bacterium]|jgi:glutaredoxin-like YruB-family protein|nr:glutaredoxin family protein [Candidatus Paceibacterota bacterium]HPT40577.1 glutaredoxin family protein [Candidatus Paceibacterota bacterium]